MSSIRPQVVTPFRRSPFRVPEKSAEKETDDNAPRGTPGERYTKSTKRVPYNALTPISIFFVVLFFIFTRAPDFAKKEGLLQSSIVTLINYRSY